jgi:hypothetical protein
LLLTNYHAHPDYEQGKIGEMLTARTFLDARNADVGVFALKYSRKVDSHLKTLGFTSVPRLTTLYSDELPGLWLDVLGSSFFQLTAWLREHEYLVQSDRPDELAALLSTDARQPV